MWQTEQHIPEFPEKRALPRFFSLKRSFWEFLFYLILLPGFPKVSVKWFSFPNLNSSRDFLETFLGNFLPVDTVSNLVGNVKRAHLKLKEARKKERLIELTLDLLCKKATWLYISF